MGNYNISEALEALEQRALTAISSLRAYSHWSRAAREADPPWSLPGEPPLELREISITHHELNSVNIAIQELARRETGKDPDARAWQPSYEFLAAHEPRSNSPEDQLPFFQMLLAWVRGSKSYVWTMTQQQTPNVVINASGARNEITIGGTVYKDSVVNSGTIAHSFNKLKSSGSPEAASALAEIAERVIKSNDEWAGKALDALAAEIEKPAPDKVAAKKHWDTLAKLVPSVLEIGSSLMKYFPGGH